MTCSVGRDCPSTTTLGELVDAFGMPGGSTAPDMPVRLGDDGPTFICGAEALPVCKCGHWSDFLCDWPVGGGKTCDIALCKCCRHEIGRNRDACEIHWHEFQNKTGLLYINPKGPRLVK